MAGEYRLSEVLSKISPRFADRIRQGELRIALTSQPITGATRLPQLAEELAAEYEVAGQSKYAKGLRDGFIVPISIPLAPDRYWKPGELFFTS